MVNKFIGSEKEKSCGEKHNRCRIGQSVHIRLDFNYADW